MKTRNMSLEQPPEASYGILEIAITAIYLGASKSNEDWILIGPKITKQPII
jgi:hypothetical protein